MSCWYIKHPRPPATQAPKSISSAVTWAPKVFLLQPQTCFCWLTSLLRCLQERGLRWVWGAPLEYLAQVAHSRDFLSVLSSILWIPPHPPAQAAHSRGWDVLSSGINYPLAGAPKPQAAAALHPLHSTTMRSQLCTALYLYLYLYLYFPFLSDPGVPRVLSMGPSL